MQEKLSCDTISLEVVKRLQEERNHAENKNYMHARTIY